MMVILVVVGYTNPASPVRLAHQTTNTFQPFSTTAAKLFPWQHEVTTPSQAAASAGVFTTYEPNQQLNNFAGDLYPASF